MRIAIAGAAGRVGRELSRQLAEAGADLVLMDLVLPVLDGWDATRQLKSLPETMAIPVIAVSSHAMSGDREKALAAGCDDYHTKPIDFDRLVASIDHHLSPDEAD